MLCSRFPCGAVQPGAGASHQVQPPISLPPVVRACCFFLMMMMMMSQAPAAAAAAAAAAVCHLAGRASRGVAGLWSIGLPVVAVLCSVGGARPTLGGDCGLHLTREGQPDIRVRSLHVLGAATQHGSLPPVSAPGRCAECTHGLHNGVAWRAGGSRISRPHRLPFPQPPAPPPHRCRRQRCLRMGDWVRRPFVQHLTQSRQPQLM
jgi:hypothetical protein